MKKIFFALFVLAVASCNNDSDSANNTDTTVTNVSGVENVNGNIPDTTNTISIEGSSEPSNTKVDSLQKQ
jgi:hypothetical protein